ncbi:hypothetical protein AWM79_01260 [Pseudomonas agarici]|uniref:Uncharacterized protein n=1 Tax=Pseudomonas agarici TaxID=46677 RepID=A0A0X1SW28_PSEAA|nr:hypothetical protein AWM79_01260 [Pseudomonas agarici]
MLMTTRRLRLHPQDYFLAGDEDLGFGGTYRLTEASTFKTRAAAESVEALAKAVAEGVPMLTPNGRPKSMGSFTTLADRKYQSRMAGTQ